MLLSFAEVHERRYRLGHATLWFPNNLGKAATPGRGAPRPRAERERGRAPSAGVGRRGVAVAAGMDARRRGGLGGQAGAWAAAQAEGPTMPALAAPFAEGRPGVWLSPRALALEAPCHGDLVGGPGALSPLARVEGVAARAWELAGAGTPGHPARRARARALAARHVARHQKTPEDLAPLSRSSMRAAGCAAPRVVGPGRLRDRRPSSSTATNTPVSRRGPPSRRRPSASS